MSIVRKKLKVCHIGWANSIHIERLMRWLSSRGHDISIITNDPKEIEGINVYDLRRKPDLRPRRERYKELYLNVNSKWLRNLNEIVRIRKLVREISPDIVHSYTLWYPGYLGVYIQGYPFVLTVLNGDILWKDGNPDIYTRIRTKLAVKKANLVIGGSEELVNACIKQGASSDKVLLMRGGVDFSSFNYCDNKHEVRQKLGLPEASKIVLSPRNTGWFYNLDKIVKAIPNVIKKVERVLFLFIWHGDETDKGKELMEIASALGVQHAVKFIGSVDYEKVALYHKASDVMVSVSRYDSGPQALLEAMACGNVPVISDLPCVREWIRDGWNGLLVKPDDIGQIGDSIIKLLEDQDMRREFSERNWKLIREKGDQEDWMGKMEEMYYSVLEPTIKR